MISRIIQIIKLLLDAGLGVKGRSFARRRFVVVEPVQPSLLQREGEKETLARTGVSRDSEDTDFTRDTLMPRAGERASERASRVRVLRVAANKFPSVPFLFPLSCTRTRACMYVCVHSSFLQ